MLDQRPIFRMLVPAPSLSSELLRILESSFEKYCMTRTPAQGRSVFSLAGGRLQLDVWRKVLPFETLKLVHQYLGNEDELL